MLDLLDTTTLNNTQCNTLLAPDLPMKHWKKTFVTAKAERFPASMDPQFQPMKSIAVNPASLL